MFVEKMDFRSTDPKDWTYENFDFRNDMVISEDGDEITLNYRAKNAETNPNGFNGYGFQNINALANQRMNSPQKLLNISMVAAYLSYSPFS